MVRIDIFCVDGRYYWVPVYISDITRNELPHKAATHGKSYAEWRVMEDKDFIFSLYPDDAVHFVKKSGVTAKTDAGKVINVVDTVCYFTGANIATGAIDAESLDRQYSLISMGIQRMDKLEKYSVDILGRRRPVKNEAYRQSFDGGSL